MPFAITASPGGFNDGVDDPHYRTLGKEQMHQDQLERTLASVKPYLGDSPTAQSYLHKRSGSQKPTQIHSKTTEKMAAVTVYGRFNKKVDPFTEFEVQKYKHAFNPDRMAGVTSYDAWIDPHQTMNSAAKSKDPGYKELNKRSQIDQDLRDKDVCDYSGKRIYKVDALHGVKNGGLFYQTTHSNLRGKDRPSGRNAFGVGGVGEGLTSPTSHQKSAAAVSAASQMISPRSRVAVDGPVGEVSEKELLKRKMYLMQKMLKNEKRANEIISNKLGSMSASMHMDNTTMNEIARKMRQSNRKVSKQ